jgi:hypothetical protein
MSKVVKKYNNKKVIVNDKKNNKDNLSSKVTNELQKKYGHKK